MEAKFPETGAPSYTGTSANCTVLRAGRWTPLSGSFLLGLGGSNVSVPHDVEAADLEAMLAADAKVFGRPTVSRTTVDAALLAQEFVS